MAGQEGFEPPTTGFGDRRSTIGATDLNKLGKSLAFKFYFLVNRMLI